MKQEHKFCAEVYHRLYHLIDHSMRILFCLDGAAAKEASKKREVECETIPDLCFTFQGGKKEIRIEAKIIENRRIMLSPNERKAWGQNGKGKAAPHFWIGANESLDSFWLWLHDDFAAKIEQHQNSKGPLLVFKKDASPRGCPLEELVSRIVAWAEKREFKPEGAR